MTLKERVEQMKALQAKLPALLEKAIETAAQRAVEKAIELTPPTGDDLSGTHTRTGEMKQHWAGDSQTKPQRQGDELTAVLANDVEYASYVDQGHRMDRHFVPGLYINPATGQLEYDPKAAGDRTVGIVVGTKTFYVPGKFIVDAAKEEYSKDLREELRKLEDLLQ